MQPAFSSVLKNAVQQPIDNSPAMPAFADSVLIPVPPPVPDMGGLNIPASPVEPSEMKTVAVYTGFGVLASVAAGFALLEESKLFVKYGLLPALDAAVGTTPKSFALGQGLMLFGPFNSFLDRILLLISGKGEDTSPDRPFLDLQGPARGLYGLLSYVPGLVEPFSKLNAKILERDFEPEVQEALRKFNTVYNDPRHDAYKDYTLANLQNQMVTLIRSGARRDDLVEPIIRIELFLQAQVTIGKSAAQIAADMLAFGYNRMAGFVTAISQTPGDP